MPDYPGGCRGAPPGSNCLSARRDLKRSAGPGSPSPKEFSVTGSLSFRVRSKHKKCCTLAKCWLNLKRLSGKFTILNKIVATSTFYPTLARGNVKHTVHPFPSSDSIQIRPPWTSMIRLTKVRPTPVPPFLGSSL